jgi:dCMP deaminase
MKNSYFDDKQNKKCDCNNCETVTVTGAKSSFVQKSVLDLDRPSWTEYFMSMAFLIAQRSIDPTKHGVVVVAQDNTILSVGYNSPPRGCHDEIVPLTRPLKYYYMSHAEINAIANAARNGICLQGATFYITGHPCAACFRSIINVGAKKIIYGPVQSVCIVEDEMQAIQDMNSSGQIEIVSYDMKNKLGDTIVRTAEYMRTKCDIHLCISQEKMI